MASSIPADAAHGSDNDLESRTSTSTFSADDATHFSYRNGDLNWSGAGGSDGHKSGGTIKGEDVICVTENKGSDGAAGYTIFSLASIDTTDVKKLPLELQTTSASNLPKECLDNYLFHGLPTYLRPAEAQIYILISTLSGTCLAPDFYDVVLRHILEAIGLTDSSYTLIRTNSAHSVREFASKELLQGANEGKKQSVLMLSGDGGVVDTLNGLLESGEKSQ
ncbi:diacylglycerol kinase catalytic domain-containing protein [Rutstroemia sp. NJR-2017a BVV2]|nr:diacylglycerol kinase catalytic domain-containing protein [Rutstroemia sp. NJR-2017a BVV2]PQE19735.1 diacylglycerol kinase catalytic domain-containing protein [Rutstroemia sp. NJR-2017a BVV2]